VAIASLVKMGLPKVYSTIINCLFESISLPKTQLVKAQNNIYIVADFKKNRQDRHQRRSIMDFERYYLDLFEMLNECCKKIASGNYDKADSDRLFELSKKGRYPGFLSELAESFGMMMVKVEAREFRLKEIIQQLEQAKPTSQED